MNDLKKITKNKIVDSKTFCVDARVLEWKRGALANFLISILPKIAERKDFKLILLFQNFIPKENWLINSNITCIVVKGPNFLRKNKTLTEQIIFPFYLLKIKPDIYLGTAYTVPIFPLRINKIAALWDISYTTHPKHYGRFRGKVLHFTSKLSSIVSNKIITCSDYDAKLIHDYYKISLNNIKVLDLGVHQRFFDKIKRTDIESVKSKYNITGDYILSLGVIYNRRKVDNIIKGFIKIKKNHPDIKLVIVGRMERHLDQEVKSIISSLKKETNIIYFDWIENDEIAQIYAGALYYICVSTLDGESIMLREAMACGTPVITSTLLMPAVKNIAIEIKNPDNINEWKAILNSSILDKKKREVLSKKGKNWAKNKTWQNTYEDFVSFLNNQV
jgi:glycosyltransferase involved in cell wall biosynthesis